MKKPLILHPLLLALFPALSLVSDHLEFVPFDIKIVMTAAGTVVFTVLAFLILRRVFTDGPKAALITSFILLWFFSYGHVFDFLTRSPLNLPLRHRHLLGAWAVLAVGLFWLPLQVRNRAHTYTDFMNAMGASLFVISAALIVSYEINRQGFWPPQWELPEESLAVADVEAMPDIYYIVLDAHASSSTLEEVYGYDNTDFVESLHERGFFIAEESRSNYAMTMLSLSSSLNMDYLDSLGVSLSADSTSIRVPMQMIEYNRVMHHLRALGYELVFAGSGYGITQRNRFADQELQCGFVDETIGRLIQTTLIRAYADKSHLIENDKRGRVLCNLSELTKVHESHRPVFAFVHFVPPHWPFMFDAEGNAIHLENLTPEEERRAYLDQLTFIDREIVKLVDRLLADSEVDPIIVLQGDHGPAFGFEGDEVWLNPSPDNLRERMRVLNAFHLPSGGNKHLYPDITPVNTFRLIFNVYFGTDFLLREDRSYYSNRFLPYQFIDVTEIVDFN